MATPGYLKASNMSLATKEVAKLPNSELTESTSNVSISRTRQILGITCGLLFYFLYGLEETVISPYFSPEASERGLNTFKIGLPFSFVEFSNFCFSFAVMFVINPKTERHFYLIGVLIVATAFSITSVLQWVQSPTAFLWLSVVLYNIIGIGVAMSLATTIPIITKLSLKNAGKITSLAEALMSFGWVVGPPFGSFLYTFLGMYAPPLIIGLMMFLCFTASIVIIPNNPDPASCDQEKSKSQKILEYSTTLNNSKCMSESEPNLKSSFEKLNVEVENEKSNDESLEEHSISRKESPSGYQKTKNQIAGKSSRNASKSNLSTTKYTSLYELESACDSSSNFDKWAYFKFLSYPNVLIVSMLGVIIAAQNVFFDVCLPIFLQNEFQLSAMEIGFVFLAYTMSNVGMIPVFGFAIDRGYAIHVTLLTALGFSATFGALYLPTLIPELQNLPFNITCYFFGGLFAAGSAVPSYLVFEKMAEYNGFTNVVQTKILVATWVNNLFSLGALMGATLVGGPIFEAYGFNFCCLVLSVTTLLFVLLSVYVLYRMKLMTKIYYVEDEEISNCDSKSNKSGSLISIKETDYSTKEDQFCPKEEISATIEGAHGSQESASSIV